MGRRRTVQKAEEARVALALAGSVSDGGNIQRGTTTLVAGVSPAIPANIRASSTILLTRTTPNASTTLGELEALPTDRVNGQPGSFKVTAATIGVPATPQAGDVSTVAYVVIF
jgi:hypothetical protein